MTDFYRIARDAERYVRDEMQVKAANRDIEGISAQAFDSAERTKIPLEDAIAETGLTDDSLIDCLAWAAVAQHSLISNCLGMAALAFAWVAIKYPLARPVGVYGFLGSSHEDDAATKLPVRNMAVTRLPIGTNQSVVMILNSQRTETPIFTADHAVCLIGDPRLDKGRITGDCYVCDPWAHRVYHASCLVSESELIARVTGGSTTLGQQAVLGTGQTLSAAVKGIIGIK